MVQARAYSASQGVWWRFVEGSRNRADEAQAVKEHSGITRGGGKGVVAHLEQGVGAMLQRAQ